jgi:hypothetical protein
MDAKITQQGFVVGNLRLCIVENAIAVDLSSTTPPLPATPNITTPHMTVLWRKLGFNTADLLLAKTEAAKWPTPVSFSLRTWGSRSYLIEGELQMLGEHLRSKFERLNEGNRPMHVELRRC